MKKLFAPILGGGIITSVLLAIQFLGRLCFPYLVEPGSVAYKDVHSDSIFRGIFSYELTGIVPTAGCLLVMVIAVGFYLTSKSIGELILNKKETK